MKLPILGLFGGDDAGIPLETVTQSEEALEAGGPDHEIVVYPGGRTRSSTASTRSSPTLTTTHGAGSWTSSLAWGRERAG